MKAFNLSHLIFSGDTPMWLAWLSGIWEGNKNQLLFVLMGQFAFFGTLALMLLFFHFRKRPSQRQQILKESLKDLDVGIEHIREEAQNLLYYLENITGERPGPLPSLHFVPKSPPEPAHDPQPQAVPVDNEEVEKWKKRAEELQFEMNSLNGKLAQANNDLAQANQQVAANATASAGSGGPDPAQAAQIQQLQNELNQAHTNAQGLQTQLQQANTNAQGLQTQLQEAQTSLQEANDRPVEAAPNNDAEINQLKQKIKFLEEQLQEYAILEEDIANIRILRSINTILRIFSWDTFIVFNLISMGSKKVLENYFNVSQNFLWVLQVWIGFEIILSAWKKMPEHKWLALLLFDDPHKLMTVSLGLAIVLGVIVGGVHFILWNNVIFGLSLFISPSMALFLCFYGGFGFASYQRIFFATAMTLSYLCLHLHPALIGIPAFIVLSQLENARRQSVLSFYPERFRDST